MFPHFSIFELFVATKAVEAIPGPPALAGKGFARLLDSLEATARSPGVNDSRSFWPAKTVTGLAVEPARERDPEDSSPVDFTRPPGTLFGRLPRVSLPVASSGAAVDDGFPEPPTGVASQVKPALPDAAPRARTASPTAAPIEPSPSSLPSPEVRGTRPDISSPVETVTPQVVSETAPATKPVESAPPAARLVQSLDLQDSPASSLRPFDQPAVEQGLGRLFAGRSGIPSFARPTTLQTTPPSSPDTGAPSEPTVFGPSPSPSPRTTSPPVGLPAASSASSTEMAHTGLRPETGVPNLATPLDRSGSNHFRDAAKQGTVEEAVQADATPDRRSASRIFGAVASSSDDVETAIARGPRDPRSVGPDSVELPAAVVRQRGGRPRETSRSALEAAVTERFEPEQLAAPTRVRSFRIPSVYAELDPQPPRSYGNASSSSETPSFAQEIPESSTKPGLDKTLPSLNAPAQGKDATADVQPTRGPLTGNVAAVEAPPPTEVRATLPADPIQRSEALAQAILARARAGARPDAYELRFFLSPPELGNVRVRIEARGEQIRVEIVTGSPAAVETLHAGIPRLTAQLQHGGYPQAEVQLNLDGSPNPWAQGGESSHGNERPSTHRNPNHPFEDTTQAEPDESSAPPRRRLDRTA